MGAGHNQKQALLSTSCILFSSTLLFEERLCRNFPHLTVAVQILYGVFYPINDKFECSIFDNSSNTRVASRYKICPNSIVSQFGPRTLKYRKPCSQNGRYCISASIGSKPNLTIALLAASTSLTFRAMWTIEP